MADQRCWSGNRCEKEENKSGNIANGHARPWSGVRLGDSNLSPFLKGDGRNSGCG